jgi:hypothetical protein
MTFRAFPPLVVTAISSCVLASACSGSSPTAKAFVDAQLESGATGGSCTFSDVTALQIGPTAMAGQTVQRVANGGINSVSCTVKASNGGFSVQAQIESTSSVVGQGGSLRITGNVGKDGTATGIDVTLNASGQTYAGSGCTITTGFGANAIGGVTLGLPPALPSVAPGRLWGHLECLEASISNGTSHCKVEADFVLENCGD